MDNASKIRYGIDQSMTMNTAESLADYISKIPTKSIIVGADFGMIM